MTVHYFSISGSVWGAERTAPGGCLSDLVGGGDGAQVLGTCLEGRFDLLSVWILRRDFAPSGVGRARRCDGPGRWRPGAPGRTGGPADGLPASALRGPPPARSIRRRPPR